ncbi:DHS-like NAD/FAD-binding domain-containing protein [Xylaria sp. CBS 124048]|nr:DHS-like NAD/FAD-binding domain-containing protein [Xylaria sp. CBS 124048]
MGQETSSLVSSDTPPQTLSHRSLAAIAELIKTGRAKKIVVCIGAGISTAAGIPDFRSPETGLYHNLARLNLPHPEAVFEIDFFRENPRPFYVLAKALYPGNFQPTISHAFVALLAKKSLLRMIFTQNIDCLERAAGVPPDLIIEAHGSFATQRCIDCRQPFPDAEMRQSVDSGTTPTCVRKGCDGLVKPDIVFFGEPLPHAFHNNLMVMEEADLVIVGGTSLTVHPFARLPSMAQDGVPRLLLNMERVGDFGTRADDVLCLGECDDGIRKLADELGWRDELETMWTELVGAEEAERQKSRKTVEAVYDGLDELTQGLEQKLKLSDIRDEHGSDTVANPDLQEKEESEKSSSTTTTPLTEPADRAPVAAEKELPTRDREGSSNKDGTDKNVSPAAPVTSKTSSEVKDGQSLDEKATAYTLVDTTDDVATAEGKTQTETDMKEAKSAL